MPTVTLGTVIASQSVGLSFLCLATKQLALYSLACFPISLVFLIHGNLWLFN